jgi:hypothetical protein
MSRNAHATARSSFLAARSITPPHVKSERRAILLI